jgi:hypothetical protein
VAVAVHGNHASGRNLHKQKHDVLAAEHDLAFDLAEQTKRLQNTGVNNLQPDSPPNTMINNKDNKELTRKQPSTLSCKQRK